jgi:hypothetical protein
MMGIALRRLLVAAALSLVAHAQTVQLGMFIHSTVDELISSFWGLKTVSCSTYTFFL